MCFIISSVKICQPISLCDIGLADSTVSDAFSNRTPCRAHFSRLPVPGTGISRSVLSSLNMLNSDGGGCTLSGTEKQRPCAWPGPWYGSWPIITTFTSEKGVQYQNPKQLKKEIRETKHEMEKAAKELNFILAAQLRDKLLAMEKHLKTLD